jgi:hypothetical protein
MELEDFKGGSSWSSYHLEETARSSNQVKLSMRWWMMGNIKVQKKESVLFSRRFQCFPDLTDG